MLGQRTMGWWWTEKLQSTGSQRVRHIWGTKQWLRFLRRMLFNVLCLLYPLRVTPCHRQGTQLTSTPSSRHGDEVLFKEVMQMRLCTTYTELNAASRKISHNNLSFLNMYIDDDDFCRNEDLHMRCLKTGKLEVLPWPKASLVAQMVKNLLAMQRPGFKSWVGEILWRREWQSHPVLQSQRVRHNGRATTFNFHLDLYTFTRPRRPGSTLEFLDSWNFALECDGPAPVPSLPPLVLPRNQGGFSPSCHPLAHLSTLWPQKELPFSHPSNTWAGGPRLLLKV